MEGSPPSDRVPSAASHSGGDPRGEDTAGPDPRGSARPGPGAAVPVGGDPRATEARNPRTRGLDRASPGEIVAMIQAEDRRVPEAVEAEAGAIAALVEDVAGRFRRGGRLFYVGAGTSGRLGVLDAAECPPTFGTDPDRVQGIIAGGREALIRSREGVEDDREAGRLDLRRHGIRPIDFVLGIATSGTTPYARAAVREAAERGAGTGFLSCSEPPEGIRATVDHLIVPRVGPEVIAGSTRMKAGTATKLVLNAVSTGVMVRQGKVYENLMVDLRAVSEKLVDRSLRILDELCGLGAEEAGRLLRRAGGSVKTAIAMHELGAERAVAERLLDAHEGFLGATLERWRGAELPRYACYPERAGAEEWAALLERLAEGPRRVRRAVVERSERAGGREPGDARGEPEAGAWTAAAHVAHLVEVEGPAHRSRIERILAAGEAGTPRFGAWEASRVPPLADREPAALLRRFERERERTLALLESRGPEVGALRVVVGAEEVTLHQLLRGAARHDAAHAERIVERIHPALRPEGG